MDLSFTDEERAFQSEVREFLADELPSHLSEKTRKGLRFSKADIEEWHSILRKKGWLAIHWPKEMGGTGWGPIEKYIFEMECGTAQAPRIVPFGLTMLAPVLMKFGSQPQKDYYLPRILSGEDWWCQGYSEPGAGSDLASLRTSAHREGDHYIVNGQKTWTTLGQFANRIFCLVRTDSSVKKQAGISFLLIDMATPGINIRPIITLDGEHEVNEVFFEDVRVPAENLVGKENQGWTYAKYLLGHERTNIANVGLTSASFDSLLHIVRRTTRAGHRLIDDPYFAARLAQLEVSLDAMRTTNLMMISRAAQMGAPGPETSILKNLGAEIRQEISSLARRAVGGFALPFNPEAFEVGWDGESYGPEGTASLAANYFNYRKFSIFGGSTEIQNEIYAKAGLGL